MGMTPADASGPTIVSKFSFVGEKKPGIREREERPGEGERVEGKMKLYRSWRGPE